MPLRSGDLSFGFIGIEDFEVYMGGSQQKLHDSSEITEWVENVSLLVGNLLYSGKETKALKTMENCNHQYDSTIESIMAVTMQCCVDVLQGFKMLEIWSTSPDYSIRSIADQYPDSIFKSGRELILKDIIITSHKKGSKSNDSKGPVTQQSAKKSKFQAPSFSSFSKLMSRKKTETFESVPPKMVEGEGGDIVQEDAEGYQGEKKPGTATTDGENEDTANAVEIGEIENHDKDANADLNVDTKTWLILAIDYDGTEYCQLVDTEEEKPNKTEVDEDQGESTVKKFSFFRGKRDTFHVNEMKLVLKAERELHFTLYEVDRELNILDECGGSVQLITFKEESVKCNLAPRKSLITSYDIQSSVVWGNTATSDDGGSYGHISVDLKRLQGFQLHLNRASSLRAAGAPDITGLDTFMEVYWYYGANTKPDRKGKIPKEKKPILMAKTAVQKNTFTPEWREMISVALPPDARPPNPTASIVIEMWNMGLFGKGAFLGQVVISLEALCSPPADEIMVTLATKLGMPAKKQKSVGGTLHLKYSIDLLEEDEVSEVNSATQLQTPIPAQIWSMSSPMLNLRVIKASNVPKADTFGASDPLALIYVGKCLISYIHFSSAHVLTPLSVCCMRR